MSFKYTSENLPFSYNFFINISSKSYFCISSSMYVLCLDLFWRKSFIWDLIFWHNTTRVTLKIDKEKTLFGKMKCWMCFFHMCSYENSCFSELINHSSVLNSNLMIYSFKYILKNVALHYVLSVLKACCWST